VTEVGGAASPLGPTGATGTSQGPIARGSVARVGTATALTALCGYAVIYLAARDLAPSGFSVFGVFWGAFGLVTGAANGLLQETTREVRSMRYIDVLPGRGGSRTRPLRVAAMVGIAAAVVIAGSSLLWSGRVFVEDRWLSVVLLSVGLAGFCLHATLLGMLAGTDQWTHYGALMVTDAVIRVAVAATTFAIGWGLNGFLWATVAGAVAWLIMLVASPAARATARMLTPGSTSTFLRGAAHSITAAGASAILVMGFPVLLKLTSNELGAQGGVIILAVTLTRAPLLVPLTAMQGNLIAHFVDERTDRLRALVVPAAIIGGIGAVGVLAAGIVGPWLLRVAFGPQYDAGSALLAWLTGAAVAIAMLTLTGAAVVAAALHRAYSLGWVGATVASGLLLLLPLPLETRTVVGLLCGPLVGIAVHLVALGRAGRSTG
jgi:O-antigen/teichoic acid export membrane protein